MPRALLNTLKLSCILAAIALGVIASLYVLGVFATEEAKEIVTRVMLLLGIFTGVTLAIVAISGVGAGGSPAPQSGEKVPGKKD